MKQKVFSMLALLLTAVTGAWAQDADEVAMTKSANNNEWTLTMPASDVELEVEYYASTPFDLTLADAAMRTARWCSPWVAKRLPKPSMTTW